MTPLPPCESCGRPMHRDNEQPFPGSVRHDGDGLCDGCGSRRRRGLTGPAINPDAPAVPNLRLPPLQVLDDALCPQTDPEIFFPELGGNAREAKAVCHRCPAIEACLEWAIANREVHGIYGGMSYQERRAYAKARRAA